MANSLPGHPAAGSPGETVLLVREVSATPAEYRHGLHMAFPGRVREEAGLLWVEDSEALLEISLAVLPPRIIAALRLPVLRATLRFVAGSAAQQTLLLAHLDRATQRGGG
jgi:hypothetical protein